MKLKYLLRGAGLGIFAAGLIAFLVTLGGNKMSDEEVIKRAKELGYASQEEVLAKINEGEIVQLTDEKPGTSTGEENHAVSQEILPADVKTSEEKTSEEKTSEEKTSEDTKTEEEKKKAEEEAKKKAEEEEKKKAEEEAKKKAEEEEKKKAEEEAKKKAEEEKKNQVTGETVTITVKSGDYSDTVAKACEAAGLVKSASDFDKYLCNNNGYSGKITVGDHKIAKGSDYETIAKALCK